MRLERKPTEIEYSIVTYIEEHWFKHKKFPSISLIGTTLGIKYEEVSSLINNDVVTTMCRNRGIERPKSTEHGLSAEQLAAANTYMNPFDRRTITQKLNDLGISPTRFNGWMKESNFAQYIRQQSEELFEDGIPIAHRSLIEQMSKGNVNAIKLFYEVSGRHIGVQPPEIQNINRLITQLLESIQMEIKDPDVVQRIATSFRILSSGGIVSPQNNIPLPAKVSPMSGVMKRVAERENETDYT